MPFKVQYEIFDDKHGAPDFQTYDFTMARVEWNERQRNPKGMLWRMEQTVIPDGALNKQEEYLFLVYRVRKLTIQYKNGGQKDDDKQVLLNHVRKLDKWNKEIEAYMRSHPGYANKMDDQAYSFYVIVAEWRKMYYERQRHSKVQNYDRDVFREMTRKIRGLENEIDKYIKTKLNLL